MKFAEKEKAIQLRKSGKTYSEILAEIPIAKSTLSKWLKSVRLATPQKQRLTKKRKAASLRGGRARHEARVLEVAKLEHKGLTDVNGVSARELWLIGVVLYWAEGSKQYDHSPSTGVTFNNSDPRMIRVFLMWLEKLGVATTDIRFELYIHETRKSEVPAFKQWWAHELHIPARRLDNVYFKKGNPKTKRKNITYLYHGLIRIKVKSSTILNRRISGWVHGIVASLGGRLMVGRETLNLSI